MPVSSNRLQGGVSGLRQALLGCFVAMVLVVSVRLWASGGLLGTARWPEGMLLVLTVATLTASLTRHLPVQNVILASAIIAVIGGAAQTLGALTGIPFGPYAYTERIGRLLFHPLPWSVPLVWVAAVLVARGVARLMLRPWRKTQTYGFRLMGLTVVLVVLLDVGWEVYASRVQQYWVWQPTKLMLNWYGAPAVSFLGWAVTTLLILAFATPALINKRLRAPPPPDYSPLAVWLLLNLLFATGAAAHRLWPAAGLIGLISAVVAVFAVRGARW